jgi:RNA-binding protein YhbY
MTRIADDFVAIRGSVRSPGAVSGDASLPRPNDERLRSLVAAYFETLAERDRVTIARNELAKQVAEQLGSDTIGILGDTGCLYSRVPLIGRHYAYCERDVRAYYARLASSIGDAAMERCVNEVCESKIEELAKVEIERAAINERSGIAALEDRMVAMQDALCDIEGEIEATQPDTVAGLFQQLRYFVDIKTTEEERAKPIRDFDWDKRVLLTALANAERLACAPSLSQGEG